MPLIVCFKAYFLLKKSIKWFWMEWKCIWEGIMSLLVMITCFECYILNIWWDAVYVIECLQTLNATIEIPVCRFGIFVMHWSFQTDRLRAKAQTKWGVTLGCARGKVRFKAKFKSFFNENHFLHYSFRSQSTAYSYLACHGCEISLNTGISVTFCWRQTWWDVPSL